MASPLVFAISNNHIVPQEKKNHWENAKLRTVQIINYIFPEMS